MAAKLTEKEFKSYTKCLKHLESQLRWFWFSFICFVVFGVGLLAIDYWCWRQLDGYVDQPQVFKDLKSTSPAEIQNYMDIKIQRVETRGVLMSLVVPNGLLGGLLLGAAIAIWFQRNYWRMLAAVGRAHLTELAPPSESDPQDRSSNP